MKPLRVALVVLVLLTAGTGTAVATADDAGSNERVNDEVRIGDQELTVSDAEITVSDTTVSGPGVPDEAIEDRRYTIDTRVGIDGLQLTYDGTRYVVGDVTITIEDVGVRVTDTTLEGEH